MIHLPWGTLHTHRASQLIIDYGLLASQKGLYTLPLSEIPFFNVFTKALLPILESLQTPDCFNEPPPLEVALQLYSLDEFNETVTVLNCLTALACIIHVVEGAKSLLCYKHVVKTVFGATKEASA